MPMICMVKLSYMHQNLFTKNTHRPVDGTMLDQVAVAAISSAALTAALVHSAVASRNDVETTDVTELWGQGFGPR